MLQCRMISDAIHDPARRHFLKVMPCAAAALALPEFAEAVPQAASVHVPAEAPVPFQVVTAASLAEDAARLKTTPGVQDLFPPSMLPMSMNITAEERKSAVEFEYHEHRAHIFQIVDGATRYEIGGTLVEPRQVKPGEWLAKTASGFKTVELAKGDVLMIPRMTPHRRVTMGQVTFFLTNVADQA